MKHHIGVICFIAALTIVLSAGYSIGGQDLAAPSDHVSKISPAATETIYTCPMHPEIRAKEPGRCPICGMTLTPADDPKSLTDQPPADAPAQQDRVLPKGESPAEK